MTLRTVYEVSLDSSSRHREDITFKRQSPLGRSCSGPHIQLQFFGCSGLISEARLSCESCHAMPQIYQARTR